jgi:hypothetical protein
MNGFLRRRLFWRFSYTRFPQEFAARRFLVFTDKTKSYLWEACLLRVRGFHDVICIFLFIGHIVRTLWRRQ